MTWRRHVASLHLQDGPVLLVGHSYGGVVITEAGNDPKVVGLVYVAAFAPNDGESINSVAKNYPPAPLGGELRPDAQGFLSVTPKGVAEDIAQDLPAKEQPVLTATQGQTSSTVFGAAVTTAAWKAKRSWSVIAKQRSCYTARTRKGRGSINWGYFNHAAVGPPGDAHSPERGGGRDRAGRYEGK